MPFLPYMDGTLFSYTCHFTKPEPEIYQHLIQKFSLTPDALMPDITSAASD